MKKLFLVPVLLLQQSLFISAQFSLRIEINGLRNNTGLILFQLFNDNEKIITQEKPEIKDFKSIITIKDLKPGKYAFRYFHDENMSGKLETNFMGIPKEGYGFSNNGSGPFGPRPFKEWLFELDSNMIVTSKTRY